MQGGNDAVAAVQANAPLIRSSAKRIDRVLICLTDPAAKKDPTQLDTPVLEISGREKIAALWDAMDLAHATVDGRCDCFGYERLVFMAGENYLFEATLIGNDILQAGNGAPWADDLRLGKRGAAGLTQWLEEAGYKETRRREDEANAHRLAYAEYVSRVFATLPDAARSALLPPGARSPRRCTTLLDHYPERPQGIVSLWKALALACTHPFVEQGPRTELAVSISCSLSQATPKELKAACILLGKAGDLEQAGACIQALDSLRDKTTDKGTLHAIVLQYAPALFRVAPPQLRSDSLYSLLGYDDSTVRSIGLSEFDKGLKQATDVRLLKKFANSEDEEPSDEVTDMLLRLYGRDTNAALIRIPDALSSRAISKQGAQSLRALQTFASPDFVVTPAILRDGGGNARLADLAWNRLRQQKGEEISLPLLGAAANSRSVYVAARARELLARHDLQTRTPDPSPVIYGLVIPPPSNMSPSEQLAALERAVSVSVGNSARREALIRLAQFRLRQGHFKEALLAFRAANEESCEEATIAALCLGRLENNSLSAGLVRMTYGLSNEFMQQATLAHMTGNQTKAEHYFKLAEELGHGVRLGQCSIAAELCRRLSGKPASPEFSPLSANEAAPSQEEMKDRDRLYLRGMVDRATFLNYHIHERGITGNAFAWWVIAMQCRIAGDVAGERTALDAGLSTADYVNLWYPMIKYRRRELGEQ